MAQLGRRLLRIVRALCGVLRRQSHAANVLGDVADSLGCLGDAVADLVQMFTDRAPLVL